MLRQLISRFTPKNVKLTLVASLSVFALSLGLVSYTASAETFDLVAEQGLQVSPVTVELNGEPGKSYTLDVNVMNVTGTDLTYGTEFFDFSAKNETGSPEIIESKDLPTSASIRTWLKAVDTFALGSHQRQALKVKVVIPKDAEPGGHYGVIAFTGRIPGGGDEQVSVRVKTGILVLIRVAGDVKESLAVESFTASSKHTTPWFIENAPIDFALRLKNTGNVHVKPSGAIEVRNMFGGLVGKTTINDARGNVLPDSIRRFEQSINKDWMIGRYTAHLTAGYGTDGQALTKEIDFWVVPYKPLLVLLALLITIVIIIRRVMKGYRKHIIDEAEKEHEHEAHDDEAQIVQPVMQEPHEIEPQIQPEDQATPVTPQQLPQQPPADTQPAVTTQTQLETQDQDQDKLPPQP